MNVHYLNRRGARSHSPITLAHLTPLPAFAGRGAFDCHPSPRQVVVENTAVRQRVTAAAILKAEGSGHSGIRLRLGRGRR